MTSGGLFLIVFGGLLVAPPVAYAAFAYARQQKTKVRSLAFITSTLIFFVFFCCFKLGLSFKFEKANYASFFIAYAAYCFIASFCLIIGSKVLRLLMLVVAGVPVALGCAAATVGLLGIMFIVDDDNEAPVHVEQMGDRLVCRVRSWGAAMTDEGYTIHIYRHWATIPFLEREVARISVNESRADILPRSATCQDALSQYAPSVGPIEK